ncbi:peptidase M23, partial [Enterococcus faecium]|nr:peptidase M23 [Enterococcus faecium]EGP4956491.1 peptidase M23 [Enterococcus faecium]EGP5364446.1 peptidase M23 [Enterococcus faecium]EME7109287.1 peptidase M23 [Enterococcus faecium]
ATSTNAAKEWIAQKESSGSYTATNGRYIGRYQLDSSYLNGDYSAANQEKVAEQYVASRYGSWEAAKAFWEANGWY